MPVYIIRAGETNMVKIGWVHGAVDSRRQSLQSAHFLELIVLRVIEAKPWVEHALHRHFASRRVRGEWFRFAPEMMTITLDDEEREFLHERVVPSAESVRVVGSLAGIIESLGGWRAVANEFGVEQPAISGWKTRGIPARLWFPIERFAASILPKIHPPITAEEIEEANKDPVPVRRQNKKVAA